MDRDVRAERGRRMADDGEEAGTARRVKRLATGL
jgi:hypothetical protein